MSNLMSIGIDIGGTKILALLMDEKTNKIVTEVEVSSNAHKGARAILKQVFYAIDTVIKGNKNINKIGVSCAGVINPRTGVIVASNGSIKNWINIDIIKEVQDNFSQFTAIRIDNDVNCALRAEYNSLKARGNFKDVNNCIMLTLGTGLGGAIIINNQLFYGDNFQAGEFGQQVIDSKLGKHKLEYILSGTGLANIANFFAKNDDYKNGKEVIRAYENNNYITRQSLDYWLEILAEQVINIYISVAIENIILGGGMINSSQYWWNTLINKLQGTNIKIHQAKMKNYAGALGAYELVKSL